VHGPPTAGGREGGDCPHLRAEAAVGVRRPPQAEPHDPAAAGGDARLLLTRRARNASGTATQCTRRNDSPRRRRPPPPASRRSAGSASAAAAPPPAARSRPAPPPPGVIESRCTRRPPHHHPITSAHLRRRRVRRERQRGLPQPPPGGGVSISARACQAACRERERAGASKGGRPRRQQPGRGVRGVRGVRGTAAAFSLSFPTVEKGVGPPLTTAGKGVGARTLRKAPTRGRLVARRVSSASRRHCSATGMSATRGAEASLGNVA
jgi:hypothetical protein